MRTLDAIQLASALVAMVTVAEPVTFVGSDRTLLAAAAAEGLGTDDPFAHS